MLKRRNAIVAFLLVAVLLLGIGYAALVDSLQITATASAAEIKEEPTTPEIKDPTDPTTPQDIFDSKVGFSACNANQAGTTSYVKVADATDSTKYANLTDAVSFTAKDFAMKGDKAVIVYTITNKHPDLAAVLGDVKVDPANDTYFKAEAELAGNTVAANGGTVDVTVTVTMEKTPVETIDAVTFTLTYGVTAE